MKWTKGPWLRDGLLVYAVHHNGDFRHGKPLLVNRFTARVEACTNQGGTIEEAEANAHLIAAAPDLYEALTDVFALLDEGYLVRNISNDAEPGWAMKQLPFIKRLQVAHAALAKARGEAS